MVARLTGLLAVAGLGLLILCGLLLRRLVPMLARLMLPASLIGGFAGLAAGPHGLNAIPAGVVDTWATLPPLLITLVFAGLFLGVATPSPRTVVRLGGPLVRFSVVTALGQYVVGLLLAWLVLAPVFGTPLLIGCLIEVGFSGGHGTAAAMAPVFADLGFDAGGALGQMSATVGLIVGVVGGVALIQWGVRHGHTAGESGDGSGSRRGDGRQLPVAARRPIAIGTVSPDVIEPFTLHLAVILLAVVVGWVMLAGLRGLHPSLGGLPLFPLAMVGGMLVQVAAERLDLHDYFDRATFQRITGVSLDLLVAAAVASLSLDLVLQNVVPFALLMLAGTAWVVVSFVWLGPRLLRTDWFEQGIVVYGTQTGVAAVGLMLLRIVDPETRTTAAQAFAARSMVTSPLLGGGLVTATMPLLVQQAGPLPVVGVLVVIMALAAWWPAPRRVSG